jgi:hypothetical protein
VAELPREGRAARRSVEVSGIRAPSAPSGLSVTLELQGFNQTGEGTDDRSTSGFPEERALRVQPDAEANFEAAKPVRRTGPSKTSDNRHNDGVQSWR